MLDWSAHYDDEGKLYYYNSKTEESSWDPPEEGFNPPPEHTENGQQVQGEETHGEDAADRDEAEAGESSPPHLPVNDGLSKWETLTADDGTEYYYNRETSETQWEKPEELVSQLSETPKNDEDRNQQNSGDDDDENQQNNGDELEAEGEANVGANVGNVDQLPNLPKSEDGPKWVVHTYDQGTEYYFNEETGETQWEKPEGLIATATESDKKSESSVDDAVDATNVTDDQVVGEDTTKESRPSTSETGRKWTIHQDDEGREFYYDTETGETQWERPDDMDLPIEENCDPASKLLDDSVIDGKNETGVQPEHEDANWVAYKDDDGREYFYNAETGETQWEKPAGMVVESTSDVPSAARDDDQERKDLDRDEQTTESKTIVSESIAMETEQEEEPVEEIDPAVIRLQEAEAFLDKADSILEPDCFSKVAEVVASQGGNATKAMTALVENYQAQTAVCGLLARWLSTMRSTGFSTTATKEESSEATNDEIRKVAQDVINRVAKERFSKETGDRILNLEKSQAAFLGEMMDSSRWRKLLIDLAATHSDSAVLMYCLRTISKRGYHREIARRINQSDHFAVFRQMMQSELTVIGTLSISSGSDVETSIGMEELKHDLRRACTATSYTYLYSLEVLRALEERSREGMRGPTEMSRRAFRKWEVLREDLENTMQDPAISASFAGSSPLFRKRRLDIALILNQLHQRQRRRYTPPSTAVNQKHVQDTLESALLNFIRRHATGVQIDDSVLDPLLPSGLDSEESSKLVGNLLVKHPLAIRALLGCLFKPGTSRVTSTVLKNKCARLLALAVVASESCHECNEEGEKSDAVAVHRLILQGSKLCEELELMVSFLVCDGSSKSALPSPGLILCNLATKNAIVANGSMMWAKELTQGPEFSASASFPTLSVSMLSLVRRIALEQPFTRKDALAVALGFTKHSNVDVSYQKINAIKEQSLRLMLCLMTKGESSAVLEEFAKRLQQQPEMDAALIRYFVAGVLEIVRVPLSLAFGRVFAQFLRSPKCVDAVRSSYFGEPHQTRLALLLKSFAKLVVGNGDGRSAEVDNSWLESLLSIYQLE